MQDVNVEWIKVSEWFKLNKLPLNLSKTNYISFGNRPVTSDNILKTKDKIIDNTNSTKFIGIIVDSKLSWFEHTSSIEKSIQEHWNNL